MEAPLKIEILSDGTNDHFVELEFTSKANAEEFVQWLKDCLDIDDDLANYDK